MNRRPAALAVIAYAAPGILAMMSIGAAVSMGKESLPGWVAVGLMVGLVAWLGYAFSRGMRRLPRWQLFGSFPLVVIGGTVLEHADRLWPVTLATAALLGGSLARSPAGIPPGMVGAGGWPVDAPHVAGSEARGAAGWPADPATSGRHERGATAYGAGGTAYGTGGAAYGTGGAAYGPGSAAPSAWPHGTEGPQDGAGPVEGSGLQDVASGPMGAVRLAGGGTIAFLLVVSIGTLALGGWALYSAIAGRNYVPDTTAVRIVGGFFGALFTLIGLAGMVTVIELLGTKEQRIEVDAMGLRRTGVRSWSAPWTDVRSVGIIVRERPGRTVRRQVVTLWVGLAPGAPAGRLVADGARPPYTHRDRLPADSLAAVDGLLRAHAGARYRGITDI
ncbi:hypothetical protein [Nostocoides vanveenii]|uniref:PH domain-containing protein n=1 Tax=Nostocoides vanveenii TaxID=330835 RepID=A0ABN2L808_9MICO